jgi:WD40 repeat protein
VFIGDGDGKILIYNLSSSSVVYSFQGHSDFITRIKPSPFNNSNYIATCAMDAKCKIWSTFDWSLIRTYSNHRYTSVFALEWIDEDSLASSSGEKIKIWSLSTGQTRREIDVHYDVVSLKLLDNKIHLAAGGRSNYQGIIAIYNIKNGSLVRFLYQEFSHNLVRDLIQITGSNLLASAIVDNKPGVIIWDSTNYTRKFRLDTGEYGARGLKQINSQTMASYDSKGTIKIWDVTSGRLIRTLSNNETGLMHSSALDVMNDNTGRPSEILISGSSGDTFNLRNWTTGESLRTISTFSTFNTMSVIDTYIYH